MAKLFLKTTKVEGKAKLYTEIRRNGLRLIVCTGIVVTIKEWQKAQKSQASQTKYATTAEGARVSAEIVKVSQAIDLLFTSGEITRKEDKVKIEQAISDIVNVEAISAKQKAKEAKEQQRHRIVAYYEEFYEGINGGTIRTSKRGKKAGNHFSEKTIQNWHSFGHILRAFCNEDVTFEDINQGFADRFTWYVSNHGYMETTLNLWIGLFVQLCQMSAADGVNNNVSSLKVWRRRTASQEEKKAAIYLTEEELNAMYSMKLSGTKELVRDMFILGALTCQRFSDYTTLSRHNITTTANGTPVVKLTQQKTGTSVEVPIYDSRVLAIMEKHDYQFPYISLETFNLSLRRVCKELSQTVPSLAEKYVTQLSIHWRMKEQNYAKYCERIRTNGWNSLKKDEKVVYKQMKEYAREHNGSPLFERDEEGHIIKYKWELVTSHTARRSGITNLYRDGILSSRDIMSISGHKTEVVFNNYVKATASEKADDIFSKLTGKTAKTLKMKKAI